MGSPSLITITNRYPKTPRAPSNSDYVTGAPSDLSFAQAPAYTLIETAFGSAAWQPAGIFDWTSIVWPIDGEDRTCAIEVRALDGEAVENATVYDVLNRVLADQRRIRVDRPQSDEKGRLLFQGYPMLKTVSWDDRRNALSVVCIDEGQEAMRTHRNCQIGGRRMRFFPLEAWDTEAPDAIEFSTLPAIFNAGGRPNMTGSRGEAKRFLFNPQDPDAGPYKLGLFTCDGDPNAAYWTYTDALRYLLYHYVHNVAINVSGAEFLNDTRALVDVAPMPNAADPFVRCITGRPMSLSVQSCNIEEALALVCESAGLHFQLDAETQLGVAQDQPGEYHPFLRVFAVITNNAEAVPDAIIADSWTQRRPVVSWIPRARSWEYAKTGWATVAGRVRRVALATAAISGNLTFDGRKVDDPLFMGGAKEYEVSMLLRPWWPPVEKLDEVAPADQDDALVYWDQEFLTPYRDAAVDSVDRLPTSLFHSLHPEHHTKTMAGLRTATVRVADVFRLWGFPDAAGEITPSQYARLAHQWVGVWDEQQYKSYQPDPDGLTLTYADATYGAGLPPGIVNNWAPIRRPFGNRISRDSEGTTDTSPTIRFHFGFRDDDGNYTDSIPKVDDPGWVVYAGKVTIDSGRALIRLDEGDFYSSPPFLSKPDEVFESSSGMSAVKAYIEGHFWVQITCTIRGDRRMEFAPTPGGPPGVRRARRQTIDLGFDRFVVRDRTSGNSYLQDRVETNSEFKHRDDTAAFEAFCRAQMPDMRAEQVAGSYDLFYLDNVLRPGDSMRGCPAIRSTFAAFPWIKTMEFSKTADTAMTTRLILTDERMDPDIGQEGPV